MKYYSETLKKMFDSEKELKAAEAEKETKAITLKKEATDVRTAVQNRVKAQIEARKQKEEAYKVYLDVCDAANEKVRLAKQKEAKALTEFCKKHPEGYHDTIKIGDVSYSVDYNTNFTSCLDPLMKLLGWF